MAEKQTLAPGLYTRVEKLFSKEGVSKQDFTKLLVGEKNKPLVEKLWRLLKSGQSLSTEFAPTGSQQQAAAPSSQPAPSQSTIQTMGTYPKEVPTRMVGGSSQKILQKLERGLRLTIEEESRIREYVNKSDPSQIKPFIDRIAGAMGIAPFTVVEGYKGGQDKINDLTPQQMKSLVLRGLIQPTLEDDPRYRTELSGDYLGGPSPSKFDAPFQGPVPPPRYTDPMDNRRDVRAKDPVAERVEPRYELFDKSISWQDLIREGYQESEVDHRKLKTYETALERINDSLQKDAIDKIREAAKEFALQSIPYEYRVLTKDATYKRKLAKNDAEAAAAAEMFLDVVLGRNNNNFVPTGREHSTGRAFVGTKISTAKEFSPQRAREIVVGRQTTTPEHEDAREVLLDFQYGRLIPGEVAAEHSYLDNASTPLSRRDIIRELQIEALQEESIAANQNEQLLANIEINPSATEAINVFLNPLAGGGSIEDKVKSAEELLTSKWDRVTNQAIDQFKPILNYLLSKVTQREWDEKTREYVYRPNPDLTKYKLLTRLYGTIQKTTGFELSAELLEQAIKEHGGFSDYYKYKNISGRNYFAGIDSQLLNSIDYNNFVADFVAEDGDSPRTDEERKNLKTRPGVNQLKSLKDKLTKKIFAVTGYTKGKQTLPGERYKTVTYKDEKGKKRTRKEKFVKGGTNLLTKGDPIYGEEFKEALKEHLSSVTLPGESGPRPRPLWAGGQTLTPVEDYVRQSSQSQAKAPIRRGLSRLEMEIDTSDVSLERPVTTIYQFPDQVNHLRSGKFMPEPSELTLNDFESAIRAANLQQDISLPAYIDSMQLPQGEVDFESLSPEMQLAVARRYRDYVNDPRRIVTEDYDAPLGAWTQSDAPEQRSNVLQNPDYLMKMQLPSTADKSFEELSPEMQRTILSRMKDQAGRSVYYDTQGESGFKEANYQAMQSDEMQSDDLKKEATARDRIAKAITKHNKTADASGKLDPSIANQIYVIKTGRRFEIVQVDDVIGTNRLGTYSRVLKNLNEVIQRLLSIETATKPRSRQTSDLFPTEANVTYSEYGVPRIDIAGMSLGVPAGEGTLAYANPGDQPTVFVNENLIRDISPQNLGAYPYGYSLSTESAPIFAQLENPYQQNVGLGIPTQPGAQQNIRMTQGDSPLQTSEDYIRHIGPHEAAHIAFPTVRVSPEERSEGIVGGRQDMEQAIEQAAYGAVNPSAYDPMASVEAREGQTGLPESRLDAPPVYVDPYRPSYLPEQAYTQPLATPQAFTTGVSDITAGGQGLPVNQSTFAVNPSINLQAFDLDNLPPVDLSNVQQDNVFTYGGLDPTTDQTVQQDFVPGTTFRATARSPISRMPEQVREFSQPIDSGFIADVQTPESFIRQNVVGQAQPFDITLEDFDGAQDTVDTSNQSLIDRMKSGAKSAVDATVGAGKKTVGAAKRTPGAVLNRINKIRASRGYKVLNRIESIVMADELAELANAAWMEGEYRKGGDVLVGGKYINNPVKEVVIGKDVNNFDELLTYLASANEDGVTEDGKTTGVAYLTEDEIRSLDSKRNKIVRDVQNGYYQSAQSHPLSKELYKDIAAYTADEDKPFGRTINILEPVDADRLASEDWSATAWDKISAGLGEYNAKSVSEPENLFPRENLIYVPLLSNSQGRATSWSEVAQMADAVAGFALTYKLPGGIKNKVLRNTPQRSLQAIGYGDAAKSYSDYFANSSYDNLGSGYLSRDESFTVRLREDVDASKFDKKKADEKLWDEIADSVPYTNLEFWSYDKESDTLTNRVSGTKLKPKDIGIPNYGDKLEAFVKYRTEMEQLSLDYSINPAEMRRRENEIRSNYEGSGSASRKSKSPPLKIFDYSSNAKTMKEQENQNKNNYKAESLAWTDEDLGYTYAQKRKDESAKEARMTGTTFGFDAETYTGSTLSDQGRIDRSVFKPKIDTITIHFDDDEYGNVELYDRRGKESSSGSWFIPSDAASTAGRRPGFGEIYLGQAGKKAVQTFYNLKLPFDNTYKRDRKYYRVIGED